MKKLTENIAAGTIALPFNNNLTEREIEYVAKRLTDVLQLIP